MQADRYDVIVQFASPVLSSPLAERVGLGPSYALVGVALVALARIVAVGVRQSRGGSAKRERP